MNNKKKEIYIYIYKTMINVGKVTKTIVILHK